MCDGVCVMGEGLKILEERVLSGGRAVVKGPDFCFTEITLAAVWKKDWMEVGSRLGNTVLSRQDPNWGLVLQGFFSLFSPWGIRI